MRWKYWIHHTWPDVMQRETGITHRVSLPCEEPPFAALVIAAPTGVIYTQQCAGHRCDHKDIEGFLVPLTLLEPDSTKDEAERFLVDSRELTAVFHADGDECQWAMAEQLPTERLDQLEGLIARYGYYGEDYRLFPIGLDRSRLADACEAWVPVKTKDGPGVLLWNNCD